MDNCLTLQNLISHQMSAHFLQRKEELEFWLTLEQQAWLETSNIS